MGSDKPDYTLGISILEQALTNLTAVVSATALDIRALNNQDKANLPTPYEDITLKMDPVTVTNEDSDEHIWQATDWGDGDQDFYISQIIVRFGGIDVRRLNQMDQGLRIVVEDGDSDEYFFDKSFNCMNTHFVLLGGAYYHMDVFPFPQLRKVEADTQVIKVVCQNYIGGSIPFQVYVSGIPR